MALDRIKFNIASFNDADAGGNNYYAGIVYEVFNSNDTLADIYSDAAGANPINQDGISNVSNSSGECVFYITSGSYYIKINEKVEPFITNELESNKKYNPDTIQEALDSTSWNSLGGETLRIKEDEHVWDTALLSSVTLREDDILACVGVPTLALVRRNKGTNESFRTTEQLTKYTMTPNRHVFGEEYLWGLHKKLIDTVNGTYIETLWSGDSTTFGVNASPWDPATLAKSIGVTYGIAISDHINKGHSGDSSVQWNSTHVDADIANNPNMRVYIARWGANDGSEHGNVQTYISNMDSGLGKLRASKGVEDLTIIVMAPASMYDPANNRSTDWFEQIIPELRKLCRKHQAVFMDTYSKFQDAKSGLGLWMDNVAGGAIHPDAALNHQLVGWAMDIQYAKVMRRLGLSSNLFTNNAGVQFNPPLAALPNSYTTGMNFWAVLLSDGWPIDGKLISKRNGNKVMQELHNTGLDNVQNTNKSTSILYRVGDATLQTWTKWYGLAVNSTLINGWVVSASRIPKLTHHSTGMCVVQGAITGGANDTIAFNVPSEMSPAWNQTFALIQNDGVLCSATVTSGGAVYIKYDGVGVVNLAGMNWQAGN